MFTCGASFIRRPNMKNKVRKNTAPHGYRIVLYKKYGQNAARAYESWSGMKRRTRNPTGKNSCYKGVSICREWESSFETFLRDMGVPSDGMSLDRIDSAKGYSPENCRWATTKQQSRNRKYCRLSHAIAKEIRCWYQTGEHSQESIGRAYGVSQVRVSQVILGKSWNES